MSLRPGAAVHVPTIGTGVVRDVRNGGRYLVEIKGRLLLVHERQLEPVERRKQNAPHDSAPLGPAEPSDGGRASLDLHGKTVEEAIEALDAFLNGALLDGCEEAHVIHGRSGGRLKVAVHARLRQIASVRSFHVDRRNPGVTIVSL